MSNLENIFNKLPRDPFPWQVDQSILFHKKMSALRGSGTYTVAGACNCGKTDAAGINMLVARSCFGIDFNIFVSPSGLIKDQVIEDFALMGLNFSAGQTNRKLIKSRLDPVIDGISCTYQQIVRFPDLFRKLTSEKSSMVVLDEVHHLANELSWGDACKHAFEHTQIRMVMSGTPFRCDGNSIPFVNYEEEA
jgi:hypothetical protein